MPGVSRLYIEINVVVYRIEAMLYHRVPRFPYGCVPGSFTMVAIFPRLFRIISPKRGAHFSVAKVTNSYPDHLQIFTFSKGAAAHQTTNTAYRNKKGCGRSVSNSPLDPAFLPFA